MVERRLRAPRLQVCGGFDGSESDDVTALRLETVDGWQFTPTYGPDKRRTIWVPAEWNGTIPRDEVGVAIKEVFTSYLVERLYYDPYGWQTEAEGWAVEYGPEHVVEWDTGRGLSRVPAVHYALERVVTDLKTGALTHDGCPITSVHVGNARKIAKPGDRYILGKPTQHQKIDAAMASVLAHEAAADARLAGWKLQEPRKHMTVRR